MQSRHLHLCPQGNVGKGHGDLTKKIVSVPLEKFVLSNAQNAVTVSWRSPSNARVPLLLEPELVPIMDAGRNVHDDFPLGLTAPLAAATGARIPNHGAFPVTARTGPADAEEALDRLPLAVPSTGLTAHRLGPCPSAHAGELSNLMA